MERVWERNSFGKRLGSMLAVDFRRMFTTRLFYIMLGVAVVIPILVLVMTTTMSGAPVDGASTAGMFTNVWQAVGSVGGGGAAMDLTSMCNINMMYFLSAVLVCLFVAEDFRSGCAKNLFAVRAKKSDYVISKTLVCFLGCALLLLGFFIGAVLGGAIAGLPFELGDLSAANIVLCMLSKVFLMAVFVAIYLVMSAAAKQKSWLSLLLSFGVGMLLFNMIPALTPLDATGINATLCLVGGVIACAVLGLIGNLILSKRDLV